MRMRTARGSVYLWKVQPTPLTDTSLSLVVKLRCCISEKWGGAMLMSQLLIRLRRMFAGLSKTLPMGRLRLNPTHPCPDRETVAVTAPKGRSQAPLALRGTLAHLARKVAAIAPKGRNLARFRAVRSLPLSCVSNESKERLCLYKCGLRHIYPSNSLLGRGYPCTPLGQTSTRLRHVGSAQAHATHQAVTS